MEPSIQVHRNPIWIVLILTGFFLSEAKSRPRTTETAQVCGETNHSASSNFIPNFITAMQAVSEGINKKKWASSNVTSPAPYVYAFSQCFGDLSSEECSTCFATSRMKLPRCLPAVSARIFLDGCFLRYDNYSFSHEAVDGGVHDRVVCGPKTDFSSDDVMREEFEKKIKETLESLTDKTVVSGGFAVEECRGGVEGVYSMAQCWRTLRKDECRRCLKTAATKLGECAPAAEGRALFTGCYVRYSTEKFYGPDASLGDEGEL